MNPVVLGPPQVRASRPPALGARVLLRRPLPGLPGAPGGPGSQLGGPGDAGGVGGASGHADPRGQPEGVRTAQESGGERRPRLETPMRGFFFFSFVLFFLPSFSSSSKFQGTLRKTAGDVDSTADLIKVRARLAETGAESLR